MRGGYVECRVYESGRVLVARFWIGADDPTFEAQTGDLHWCDTTETMLPLGDVGPVAWSEGIRMAAAIHGKRVVESEERTA